MAFFFVWLIIAVLFLLLEMGHPGLFFFLSFSCGALIASLVSLYSQSLILQSIIFLISTFISLFILKQWIAKKLRLGTKHTHTNMYALEGKHAVVLQSITPTKPGLVKINGEIWTARSLHDGIIHKDVLVQVIRVSGAHVVVKKIEKS